MIHYAIAIGTPEAVERAQRALAVSIYERRVFEGELLDVTAPSRRWGVVALQARDPFTDERLVVDGDCVAMVNGPALADVDSATDSLASELLAKFVDGGTEAVSRALGGDWNFVAVTPSHGLRALSDYSGMSPIYWGQGNGVTVVSNRSRAVSAAVSNGGWDLGALTWLVGQNLRGDRMPAQGARLLRPGVELRVDFDASSPTLQKSPEWIWPHHDTSALRHNLTSDEWDEVTEALVANVRAIGNLASRPALRLSGGKDSRLALALALGAGLGDELLTITSGAVDSPEVECATEVARVAVVEHRRVGPPGRSAPTESDEQPPARAFEPEPVWKRLRQHSYRYEGIVTPWDGMNDRLRHVAVQFTGFGGEIYRRGMDKRLHRADLDKATFIGAVHESIDPGAIRHAAAAERQLRTTSEWFDASLQVTGIDSIAEKWYIDYRLSHWNGPLNQSKPGHIILSPLSSSVAARKQLELTPEARAGDRLIYEVMKRLAPELAILPFMGDTWNKHILETADLPVATEPFPTTYVPSRFNLVSWQNQFVEHQQSEIGELFRQADRETDFGLMFSAEKLRASLADHAGLSRAAFRQIISCVGIATTLLGHEEQVVDDCAWAPPLTGVALPL